jgi:DNA-binding MarR family transcriptional regulator
MTSALATTGGRAGDRAAVEAAELRRLMMRRGEAAERHRTIAGKLLGLDRTEAAAMALVAATPSVTVGTIVTELAMSSAGASLLVQRLERHRSIERRPFPRDLRQTLLAATPEHVEAAAQLYSPSTPASSASSPPSRPASTPRSSASASAPSRASTRTSKPPSPNSPSPTMAMSRRRSTTPARSSTASPTSQPTSPESTPSYAARSTTPSASPSRSTATRANYD